MFRQIALTCSSLAVLLGVATPAASVTRHVPADFPTIQQAINASAPGDEVIVDPGTYVGNILIDAARNGLKLHSSGGAVVTRIDGGLNGPVVTCGNVGAQTLIAGFTITHGNAGTGGGLYLLNASPTIRDNVIRDNNAVAAGGIYADASSPYILNNQFLANHAPGGSGGAIYCDHGSLARIEGNVIAGNTCGAYGAGISIWESSSPSIVGNTLFGNSASLTGGGIYVVRSSHPTASENIVVNNPGGGIVMDDLLSSIDISCGDVFANTPNNFGGVTNPTGSAGNLSVDPLFCNAPVGEFTLMSASPCAAGNVPQSCSQMGALGVGCGTTVTSHSTWGEVKLRYR